MRFLEVQTAQLESIRMQTYANDVSLVSKNLETRLEGAISNSQSENLGSLTSTTINTAHLLGKSGGFQFTIDTDNKKVNIYCWDKSEPSKDEEVTAVSRRRELISFNDKQTPFFLLSLHYQQSPPDWLNSALTPSDKPTSFKEIKQLVLALNTVAKILRLQSQHNILMTDNLTQLNTRLFMQVELAHLCERHTVSLIMIHCRGLQAINQQYGMLKGDKIITEIAQFLQNVTREEDILCRFGGALFGIAFPVIQVEDAEKVANKLLASLQSKCYLEEKLKLEFCLGTATVSFQNTETQSLEAAKILLAQADQSLTKAQKALVEQDNINADNIDISNRYSHLNSIFTADPQTDYRNMLLLWDITSTIAGETDFETLLEKVISRLAKAFNFNYAGLYGSSDVVENAYAYKIDANNNAVNIDPQHIINDRLVAQLAKQACASHLMEEFKNESLAVVVTHLGINTSDCFYLYADNSDFVITQDTKALISSITLQLGKALRRVRLEQQVNAQLQNQVEALLQDDFDPSKIVHRSESMKRLLRQAQRAATSDATVLITGESGTGKERLMHAIHQFSPRRSKPLVIVDCGAIPETLIESELFGHAKGAFTGATGNVAGKIKEANNGTLILDEIGELPLLMQSKLLRFVQEKHYTPVGSSEVYDVDVKIVAITNRDLAAEVQRGSFRKDLYYRLNVVTLNIPPLRERREDIPLLANYFLNLFAHRYGNGNHFLSAQTLESMKLYDWPGNIRELENCLMQAMLLSESNEISIQQLNLANERNADESTTDAIVTETKSSAAIETNPEESHEINKCSPSINATPYIDENTWRVSLSQAFTVLLEEIERSSQFRTAPIGKWIEDDLVLEAYRFGKENIRDIALKLDISLSTARRRVLQVTHSPVSTIKPDCWPKVLYQLSPIARGELHVNNCLQVIKLLLLEQMLQTTDGSMSLAAQRLGVSEPTFYKLKKQLS